MAQSATSATFHIPRSAQHRSGAKSPGEEGWDMSRNLRKEMPSIANNSMAQAQAQAMPTSTHSITMNSMAQAQAQALDTLTLASAHRIVRCLVPHHIGGDIANASK
eukprot:TRINITY_DN3693_c1_g1_i1.p2 TRINITY_DN3693_c1_g1~~TRINITY_DN3693_c1_g1_i1.p2  ORF type:complete len:106 (-),score=4.32 TRINITY_DN3693_c1_g1_i1:197-514(-)